MATNRSVWLGFLVASFLLLTGFFPFCILPHGAAEPTRAANDQGRIQGRITDAITGKPVAGAKVRALIQGVPGNAAIAEGLSDANGRYAVDVPLGHCGLWGVHAPAGYYTQDPKTWEVIVTTAAEPQVVRDFALQPGSPWALELHGARLPMGKSPTFMAWPNAERVSYKSGEVIRVSADARGKAVLTIPSDATRYYLDCIYPATPSRYEIPSASLELDAGFDPRQIRGAPEELKDRKAIRLRDAAGRTVVVEGVEVLVEGGHAVLRFPAKSIAADSALVLRGSAADENGRPVTAVKFTAAFETTRSGSMSQLEATSDAQGRFELPGVLLPQDRFADDSRISMIAIKSGYHGAQTNQLNLMEVKRAGNGDFGQVVLKPGKALRGKVVDENDRPVHGALVSNMTNGFLYSHLCCRTDAKGQFVMPDLAFGEQNISVRFGERVGQAKFEFDAANSECVIAVRTRANGGRLEAPGKPPPAKP